MPFMKWVSLSLTCSMLLYFFVAAAQSDSPLKWRNPAEVNYPVIEGQAWWGHTEHVYDRLPAKAKGQVRDDVWNLGRNTAGEYIRFTTNASSIVVRYAVDGAVAMPHMPATGVSGVDLYARGKNGEWLWASGTFKFADTIEYRFTGLNGKDANLEYRLYLPLYNSPKWLAIAVDEKASFNFSGKAKEKPIVVYGTSIAQGGCASRPGLGWTNILNRLLNTEIINLAFSGNGRLEPPVTDLINEIDASLFVLDCLPNLVDRKTYPAEELQKRIITAVETLRAKHPSTPILLAEHAISLPLANMNAGMINLYAGTNKIFLETFALMKKQGIQNIHLITAKEMGLNTESTVDGTHPNDIGMAEYAQAYARKIKQLRASK